MNRTIIAIVGASASGKTRFSQTLSRELNMAIPGCDLVLLEEDAYYRDLGHLSMDERLQVNFDHPESLELELLAGHLRTLRDGKPVEVPVYDYKRHTRSNETHLVQPATVILVEGILLFTHVDLLEQFDIKLFIETPLDLCLIRRIHRDMESRGRTLASILEQYENNVRPMYEQFIVPSRRHADLLISGGGDNRVALELVKAHVQRLLENPVQEKQT